MPSRLDIISLRRCALAVLLMLCMLGLALLLLNSRTAHSGRRLSRIDPGLESFRVRASGGDWSANRTLTRLLLKRYEAGHENDDLFEAMVWLEMDWDDPTVEHADRQRRIFQRHCGHRIVRWHWLCNAGE